MSFLQLAYDIDKDAEEQNTYLDGMVGILQMFKIPLLAHGVWFHFKACDIFL